MKPAIYFLSLLLLMLVSGCAFSDAKLDVKYDESIAEVGPLSSVNPLKIKVEQLQDNRPFFDKIGDKKNAYGMDCADVVTTSPVPDVIHDAIVAMLEKNGHSVTDQDADIAISGVIETFWFESQMNFWTIEFMGTADVNLEFKEVSSEKVLLSKHYSGYHNEKLFSGYHKEMQMVMNQTLEDLIRSISMDNELLGVMQSCQKPPLARSLEGSHSEVSEVAP